MNKFKLATFSVIIASILFIASCDTKSGKREEPVDKIEQGTVKDRTKSSKEEDKFENKERLIGVWLKRLETGGGYEGYNFKKDYTLELENIYLEIGDKWELDGDTISVWTHTERYPDPQQTRYFINELNDSLLIVSHLKDTILGAKEIYRKKQ